MPADTETQASGQAMHQAISVIFNQPLPLTNYLCHYSKQHSYVYMETPKVACTTVKRVLQQAEVGGGLSYNEPGTVHDRSRSPLLAPMDNADEFIQAMQDPDYFRFCFVRNPFTRTLSCYLDKLVKVEFERRRLGPKLGFEPDEIPTFNAFLHAVAEQTDGEYDIHWAPQTYLLRPNRIQYSFIGRFELFGEHFKMICEKLEISQFADLSGTWHATNAYEKVKDYLGKTEIELIHRIYERDFRNFGYGWSPEVI